MKNLRALTLVGVLAASLGALTSGCVVGVDAGPGYWYEGGYAYYYTPGYGYYYWGPGHVRVWAPRGWAPHPGSFRGGGYHGGGRWH